MSQICKNGGVNLPYLPGYLHPPLFFYMQMSVICHLCPIFTPPLLQLNCDTLAGNNFVQTHFCPVIRKNKEINLRVIFFPYFFPGLHFCHSVLLRPAVVQSRSSNAMGDQRIFYRVGCMLFQVSHDLLFHLFFVNTNKKKSRKSKLRACLRKNRPVNSGQKIDFPYILGY